MDAIAGVSLNNGVRGNGFVNKVIGTNHDIIPVQYVIKNYSVAGNPAVVADNDGTNLYALADPALRAGALHCGPAHGRSLTFL